MITNNIRTRGKLAFAITLALTTSVLIAPLTFAAEPSGSGPATQQKSSSPSAYTLMGDTANIGGAVTTFLSGSSDTTTGPWYFLSSSSTGGAIGLTGECNNSNNSCTGVQGRGSRYGVYGEAFNAAGYGVKGQANGSTNAGVWGANSGTGSGVRGESSGGLGVYGTTGSANPGVYGDNTGSGNGVEGGSVSGNGVYGRAYAAGKSGVYGLSSCATCAGVTGNSTSGNGVYGTSATGVALFGNNTGSGSGFYGYSANGPGGVMGSNTTEGARFYSRNLSSYAIVTGGLPNTTGNVYINGRITATGGCCAAARTDQGTRQMYAEESTTSTFSDKGVGTLVNGQAVITIDKLYAQTVNLTGDYVVLLTPYSSDTLGLGAINLTSTGFEVRELNKGKGNFKFSWRIEAPRKGYEGVRMAPAEDAPGTDGKAYEMPAVPVPASSTQNK